MLPQSPTRDDGNAVLPAPGKDLLHIRHGLGKDDRQGRSHLRIVLVAAMRLENRGVRADLVAQVGL